MMEMKNTLKNTLNNNLSNTIGNAFIEDHAKSDNNYMLLFQCFVVALFIVVGLAHKITLIMAIAFLVILILKSEAKKTMLIMFFILPFANIFKFNPAQISMFTFLTILVIIQLFLKNLENKLDLRTIVVILLFAVYLFCFSGFEGLVNSLNILGGFLLMFLYFNLVDEPDLTGIIVFFSCGIIFSSFFGVFQDKIPQLREYITVENLRFDDRSTLGRFAGLTSSSNYYTADISIALSGLVVLFINKKLKLTFYILAVTLSIFGLMSVSKSFLFSLGALLLIYLFAAAKTDAGTLMKSIFSLLLVGLGILYFLGPEYVNGYMFRLNKDFTGTIDLAELTTNRSNIWAMYYDFILNDFKVLFLGNGVGGGNLNGSGAHNSYIDMIYFLGFLGSALFIWALVAVLKVKTKMLKRDLVNYVPLFLLATRAAAISLLFNNSLFHYFIIIFIVLNTDIDFKNLRSKKVLRT